MNFADSARDIRTNFVRICRIRTNFVRISYKFVRNSYEIRTNISNSGPKVPGHNSGIVFGRRLGLMGPFGVGLSLNHGD